MATYKGISLDTNLERPYMPTVISTAVGDKESVIFDHVTVGDNFVNKNLAGVSIEFVCTLPDGKSVFSDTSGVNVDDAAKGIFTYTVPANFARISGEVRDARFRFTKGKVVESSSFFKMLVYKTPGILEQGGDYFNRLEDYLKLGMQFSNDLEEMTKTADATYKAELTKLKAQTDSFQKELTKTFTQLNEKIVAEKNGLFKAIEDEKATLFSGFESKFNLLKKDYESALALLNDELTAKLTDLETKKNAALDKLVLEKNGLIKSITSEKDELFKKFNSDNALQVDGYQKSLTDLETKKKNALDAFETSKQNAVTAFNTEKTKLFKSVEDEKASVLATFKTENDKLQTSYQTALNDLNQQKTEILADLEGKKTSYFAGLQTQFDEKSKDWDAFIKKLNVDGMETQITAIKKSIDDLKAELKSINFDGILKKSDLTIGKNLFNSKSTNYVKNGNSLDSMKITKLQTGVEWLIESPKSNGGGQGVWLQMPYLNPKKDYLVRGKISGNVKFYGFGKGEYQKFQLTDEPINFEILFNKNKNGALSFYSLATIPNSHIKVTDLEIYSAEVASSDDLKDVKNYVEADFAKKGSILLQANDDFNNITQSGFYGLASSSYIDTIKNYPPIKEAFYLVVENLNNEGNYVRQTISSYHSAKKMVRWKDGFNWTEWYDQPASDNTYTKSEVDTKITNAIAALKTELTKGDK